MRTVSAIRADGAKGVSHAAACPTCLRTTRIKFLPTEANIRGGCVHLVGVARIGERVTVEFRSAAA